MAKKLIWIINFIFLQWFGLRLKIRYPRRKWEILNIPRNGGPWYSSYREEICKKITLLKNIKPLSGWRSGVRRIQAPCKQNKNGSIKACKDLYLYLLKNPDSLPGQIHYVLKIMKIKQCLFCRKKFKQATGATNI